MSSDLPCLRVIVVTTQAQAYDYVHAWCKQNGHISASFSSREGDHWIFEINESDPEIEFQVQVDMFGQVSRHNPSRQ